MSGLLQSGLRTEVGGRFLIQSLKGAPFVCVLGCAALTREEAREAVEEARLYSEAASLTGNTVELSENFSIGQGLTASVENLRDFYESELPCAEVQTSENTVTVEYGALGDDCEHRGMTFSGTHSITVIVNEDDELEVHHEWLNLSNGELEVSGSADVTWSGGDDPSRHIVSELSWKRLADGRAATGRGDRVQRPLDGDLSEGFTVDGDASWSGESGRYDLSIVDVEMRWVDPVPQNGRYVLATPFDESLTLEFHRADPRTIDVVVKSGRRQFEFEVATPR